LRRSQGVVDDVNDRSVGGRLNLDGVIQRFSSCRRSEQHVLGLRMVADVFEGAGYDVRFLGAGVPESSLEAWVSKHHPAIVALGATMPLSAATLTRQLHALHDRNPDLV
jgi:methanogenic corrinoid protein MtbC1